MGLPLQIMMAAQSIVCQAMPVNRPAPSKAAAPQTGPLARPAGFSQVLSLTFQMGSSLAWRTHLLCAYLSRIQESQPAKHRTFTADHG